MNIKIKISRKPVEYSKAINYLEKRVKSIQKQKDHELLWICSHPDTYTAGVSSKNDEILDKNINIIKTNRGGKITWHGPGQKIFYFVINLTKRDKDIRKFVNIIEKTIIDTLKEYKISAFADRKNIGIWIKKKNKILKIAAIGIKVKRWIAYHGFSVNIDNNLQQYEKIIPCGVKNKGVTNLMEIKKQNFKNFDNIIIRNFLENLKS
ncbi:MAG: lipoyl(octanoyl) transferase LipB [Candidatus Pelagibacter sp.]